MKIIKLKDIQVKIRRAKVKEVKNLIKDTATKATKVADFFFNKPMTDKELINSLPNLIIDNIEFFEDYVLQFTADFTQDDFDNLELLDATELIKQIIVYNGVNEKFLKSFFYNLNQVMEKQTQPQEMEFVKKVPKV